MEENADNSFSQSWISIFFVSAEESFATVLLISFLVSERCWISCWKNAGMSNCFSSVCACLIGFVAVQAKKDAVETNIPTAILCSLDIFLIHQYISGHFGRNIQA